VSFRACIEYLKSDHVKSLLSDVPQSPVGSLFPEENERISNGLASFLAKTSVTPEKDLPAILKRSNSVPDASVATIANQPLQKSVDSKFGNSKSLSMLTIPAKEDPKSNGSTKQSLYKPPPEVITLDDNKQDLGDFLSTFKKRF
jgi:hypothetical protein